MVDAFADAILSLDDSMPNGTYIDMCSKLPIVDPARISAPTLIMRGEFDGIAAFDDLIEFFKRLPTADKQFTVMPGISHASFQQKNYPSWSTICCMPGSLVPTRSTRARPRAEAESLAKVLLNDAARSDRVEPSEAISSRIAQESFMSNEDIESQAEVARLVKELESAEAYEQKLRQIIIDVRDSSPPATPPMRFRC